eukprot:TRINITY_DN75529_c0_g1_i1.p1 TRINITY_DN75529_c0_g1~~TRINITY_DN75529_c0_g1_i1.p1  ORF type:complete len:640 (+),score=102.17 TRINITY_DN75529_c0_g1_i1:41-1960(+)
MEALLALAIFGLLAVLYYAYDTFFKPRKPPTIVLSSSKKSMQQEDEDTSKPLCKILFGSQTGTAEMFSKTLAKQGQNYGFRTRMVDLLDYDKDDLETEGLVLFVVATYGEGEPTDSAKDFYEWFAELEQGQLNLSDTKYAVFGLGDTQYKHFNEIGKITDEKMEQLGAVRMFERGVGDADKTLEEDFEEWSGEIWPHLAQEFKTEYDATAEEKFTFEPATRLQIADNPTADWRPFTRMRVPSVVVDIHNPRVVYAKVTCNKELLNNSERSTRHVELSVEGTPLKGKYEAGDHLAIYPPNNADVVEQYLSVLDMGGLTPDTVVGLVGKKHGEMKMPTKCTVRQALTWYIDLPRHAKKDVLKTFSTFATDEQEKEEFQSLLKNNPDAKAKYKKLSEKLNNPFCWLRKFRSVKVPLFAFLEVMPRLQPRYYSIASDSIQYPDSVHVCAAYTEGGLCTTFLKNCQQGDEVPCYIRRSTFHLPACKEPVICVGPGTGVAPLIGFLWRRIGMKAQGKDLPQCHFYFGCRSASEDYIYQELMERCLSEGIIDSLNVAFSRDQAQKVYVQHKLAENKQQVFEILGPNKGRFYICGDAKHMAKDVDKMLTQIVQECGGDQYASQKAAEQFITRMENSDRYLKDVWTVH